MTILNPLHAKASIFQLNLPPGRQGIVLERREDGRFYLDEFLAASKFIRERAGSKLRIGDVLSHLNGIDIQGMSPRKIKRLFRQPIDKCTIWERPS